MAEENKQEEEAQEFEEVQAGEGNQHPQLQADTIDHFLVNQSRELDIQEQQLRLQEKDMDYNHEIAKLSLDKQDKWVNRLPDERRKDWTLKAKIIFLFSLLFILLISILLYSGLTDLVIEIIKAVIYVVIGGGGGYGYGFYKGKNKTDDGDEP